MVYTFVKGVYSLALRVGAELVFSLIELAA